RRVDSTLWFIFVVDGAWQVVAGDESEELEASKSVGNENHSIENEDAGLDSSSVNSMATNRFQLSHKPSYWHHGIFLVSGQCHHQPSCSRRFK
ncbi:Hypothetical predicted protein, partial [Olea europaea subsp. europaea]